MDYHLERDEKEGKQMSGCGEMIAYAHPFLLSVGITVQTVN